MVKRIENPDAQLVRLAVAFTNQDWNTRTGRQVRGMIKGRAWKLIQRTYTVPHNREIVWREWVKLADIAGEGL